MVLKGIARRIENVEARTQSLGHWVMAFLSIVFLRIVLEGILEPPHRIGLSADPLTGLIRVAHDTVTYLAIFLSVVLAVRAVSGAGLPLRPLTRIALLGLPVILLPPLLDGLLTGGAGFPVRYQKDWSTFPAVFVHSFNPLVMLPGITPGQRVEVFLVCLGAGAYLWLKRRSASRAALAFLASYGVICLYAFFPAIWGSLATALLDIHVPQEWAAADAVFVGSGGPSFLIDLRFVFFYIPTVIILGTLWWLIIRLQERVAKGMGECGLRNAECGLRNGE